MAETSFPFAGTTRAVVSESQQRAYYSHLGDGVINARTLSSLSLTADGTSVLRLQPGEAKVRGLYYENDAAKSFNIATIGNQPGAGQSRLDVLALRLDMTGKDITSVVVPGLPSTNPSMPALSRSSTGVYEDELWSWRWTGTGLTQPSLVDRRKHIGPTILISSGALLPSDADLGTTARRAGVAWHRELVGTTPTWVNPLADVVADAARDRLLFRTVGIECLVLSNGSINATGAVIGGATRTITSPPGTVRALIRVDVTGVGPETGTVNALLRLVANGVNLRESRIRGRSGMSQATYAIGGNQSIQLQTFMRVVSGQTLTIGAETQINYRVDFS